jgi:serine/threonine-protein kinase RsbW
MSDAAVRATLRRPLVLFAVVGVGYALCSQLSYSWFNANGVSASFFPAAGVTLAALVLVERRRWPIVIAAAAAAELTLDLAHGIALLPTLGYVAANTIEPLVGALLLTSFRSRVDLARVRHLWAFFVLAVLLAPLVGGIVGATSFVFLDSGTNWVRFAAEWWIGDGLGVLVMGGALLSLRSSAIEPLGRVRLAETVLLAAGCIAGTVVLFWLEWLPAVYVPIGILLTIAIRAGTKAVALTATAMAFVAAEATAGGHVFWSTLDISPDTALVYLQLTLAVVIGSALVLAAEIGERHRNALAWATADAARRSAASAAARSDRLRSLAEDLADTSSRSDVTDALAKHELVSDQAPDADRLLREYALRMATGALERARLLEDEREARARAELLERNAAHLAAAATARDVARSTVSDLVEAGFEHVGIFVPRDEKIRALGARGLAPETLSRIEGRGLDAELAVAEVMRTGKPLSFTSGAEYDARYPLTAAARGPSRLLESRVALPLFNAGDKVIGALYVASKERDWLDERRAHVLGGVAQQCGLALDRAALFEAERDLSRELQLGLLGGELPDVEGLVVSSGYRPGTEELNVGGDWYDAFVRPNGSLALVVGDVVGHGLEAAVVMGQLRGAVRALAVSGTPVQVVERLDAFVETLPAAELTTLAYVELEPASGAMRYACAGHPPPLVVGADGRTRFLWDGRSAPLGSILGHARSEASERLGEGETLVLYTDGLVERRGESLDVGLRRLASAASCHPPGWQSLVGDICDELLEGQRQVDDVCLLTLFRTPQATRFTHAFLASPSELAPLRARLRTWLREAEVGEEAERSAVLAVSEAAANAVEHAYGCDGEGVVTVEAYVDEPGELHVAVRDSGTWRHGRPEAGRGRGTPIMEAVMSTVELERGETATVVRMRRPAREHTAA